MEKEENYNHLNGVAIINSLNTPADYLPNDDIRHNDLIHKYRDLRTRYENLQIVCERQSEQILKYRLRPIMPNPEYQTVSTQTCDISEDESSIPGFLSREKLEQYLQSAASTISDLRQKLAQSEYIITLLQGENSTIDEYVSLYLKQRERLEKRYENKEAYMRNLYSAYSRCKVLLFNFKLIIDNLCTSGERKATSASTIISQPDNEQLVNVCRSELDKLVNLSRSVSVTIPYSSCQQALSDNTIKSICICQYCKGALYRV
ncbi:hypothetical protein GJ496_002933 [Pomphorhynchus laevis]|nr:hypothetical protein GJ496_002933 [Pomphorhynchus laevis]